MKNLSGEMKSNPDPQKESQDTAGEDFPLSQEAQPIRNIFREKIELLIMQQENELTQKQEALDEHLAQMRELQVKRDIAKRSLRLAKKKKLAKNLIGMIRDERKMLKANIRELKGIIKEQKNSLIAKREAIELLKTLI
jgi:hypothetical protein